MIVIEDIFVRIECHESYPLIVIEVLQQPMAPDNPGYPLARGLDDGQQPHGFVVGTRATHHGLPGKSGAQIALRAGHHTKTTHNVMINLAAAAINVGINCGEVMLHVDPLRDNLRAGQYDFQQAAGGVFLMFVGVQENPPLQVKPAAPFSPTDKKGCIA